MTELSKFLTAFLGVDTITRDAVQSNRALASFINIIGRPEAQEDQWCWGTFNTPLFEILTALPWQKGFEWDEAEDFHAVTAWNHLDYHAAVRHLKNRYRQWYRYNPNQLHLNFEQPEILTHGNTKQ